MHVILLERVARLGKMGETVEVKDGFARNFLLPQGKALRATAINQKYFENRRAELIARNNDLREKAEQYIDEIQGKKFAIIRAAGETGHLYGSVSPRDIATIITNEGFSIDRNQVKLDHPIKTIGIQTVAISLHPEVEVEVTLNVARTEEEAKRQAKGEDMSRIDNQIAAADEFEEEVEDIEEAAELEEEIEALEEAKKAAEDEAKNA